MASESSKDEANQREFPTLRVGLVGCGFFGLRAHLPALQRLSRGSGGGWGFRVELTACVARSEESRKRIMKRLGKASTEVCSTFAFEAIHA